ncbi:unnamed protein product [Rangifer tarandus platyrhynchus]|uniref:Uncharacterized protein n=2 Tax=Rangifer tarandus platyrhynchus TaxID=3082113 RepID=A0ACB0F2F6_RANTA|nr:unnamed protein product [Rangifer tarandus platyrhynchus]CAI9707014.1 unnamed protein product [Rangifer tarandus platyrhynchus]
MNVQLPRRAEHLQGECSPVLGAEATTSPPQPRETKIPAVGTGLTLAATCRGPEGHVRPHVPSAGQAEHPGAVVRGSSLSSAEGTQHGNNPHNALQPTDRVRRLFAQSFEIDSSNTPKKKKICAKLSDVTKRSVYMENRKLPRGPGSQDQDGTSEDVIKTLERTVSLSASSPF